MLCLLHMNVKNGFDGSKHLYNHPLAEQLFFVSQTTNIGLAETDDLLHPASRLLSRRLGQINL